MNKVVRVSVLLSDLSTIDFDLDRTQVVLIGRKPDPEAARRAGVSGPMRTIAVDAPGVSANHVVLRHATDGVHVLDLQSRNGTWVRAPERAELSLGAPPQLALRLATVPYGEPTPSMPPPAEWRGADDFPGAIARAVQQWLGDVGEDAELVLSKDGTADPAHGTPIPLTEDTFLVIRPRRTVDATWSSRIEALWRFVDAQRQLFAAEQTTQEEGMVLASRAVRSAHQRVIEAATRHRRLVLMGPTGSGKEGLARVYHRHSGRSGPFVAIDCSQLDRELLRAELFGAEEGAFTGSVRRIVGAVEHANGGTLFLDEIGELPLDVQPMLLRFLDRGEYIRLGSYDRRRTSDVLVVCATHRDLRAQVQEGMFREDLWFRLAIEVVELPGLEARCEDVTAYLAMQAIDGCPSLLAALSPDALELLREYPWPGNFRELANFVTRLPERAAPGSIDAATCKKALERGAARPIQHHRSPEARDISQWASWAEASLRAFEDDHGGRAPARWDDVQEYIERYLKPLLMVRIGGIDPDSLHPATLQKQARLLADALDADRGTAFKQLTRYFERYR